ncbi:MAG: riboflavin synthase [Oleiphilaceae bacterium]|nr:riboflavin synthase [Oleiphilaceae bacterium]
MFTGIIEATGTVRAKETRGQDLRLQFASGALDLSDVKLGDSIAVNGVCLTVVALYSDGFAADVSLESLRFTTIQSWQPGTRVNLEKALTLSTRLGGHLVSGHVDGVGRVIEVSREGRSLRYVVRCDAALLPYIAAKGSICIDGVSLTVTSLEADGFCLNIVPHTAEQTIIPGYQAGTDVHIEVDMMARYAERLMSFSNEGATKQAVDLGLLARNGFLR